MNASEVKKMALSFGADLIGFSPIGRMSHLPKEENPLSIFPQAKSLIVIARKIPHGSLRGIVEGTEMDNSFNHFGLYFLEDQYLAKTTYDLTIWIEAQGFEAVPMFAYDYSGQPQAIPVEPGKPAPNVYVDYQIAAQAAGLGEIGLNGIFLTPEFGPLQRFAMLLTDIELESDKVLKPSLCVNCRACIDACPLKALNSGKNTAKGVPEMKCEVAEINKGLCAKCRNGAIQCDEGRFYKTERISAACGRACLATLDEKGLLKAKFRNKFKVASSWERNYIGEIIQN
jgi:epoxyqueuosine reductase QueG